MIGVITTEYDISLLTRQISNLKGFLLGSGATPGQCQDVLRVQAGLLAWEISKQVGPATLPQGRAGVEKDMRNVFFPLTAKDQFTGKRIGTRPDFLWLFAYGPGNRKNETRAFPSFLVGADAADMALFAPPDHLLELFYKKENRTRGAAWKDMGTWDYSTIKGKRRHYTRMRANQHAIKIDRIVITPKLYQQTKKLILDKLGQLRASFARAAVDLGLETRIPKWVLNQVENVKGNGKSIFNNAAMNHPTNPVIEFGSRAKGVVSNPIVAEAIRGAVKTRTQKLAKTMMNVIRGGVYKFNTGQSWVKERIPEE